MAVPLAFRDGASIAKCAARLRPARAFTATFAGIAPQHVAGFIAAELIGAALAVAVFAWLLGPRAAGSARATGRGV
ncbi:MAG TPA: hypothetical protein VKV32_04190 [Stellaceae bacterium]|nr:hypothetical protein [Stellaceae bacterium]